MPHFLELLLMSGHPQHRDFCSNIKYVILDEVHCIADQEEGPKWERIIQLLPCPFLAMSATVRLYTRPKTLHPILQTLRFIVWKRI